MLEQNIYMSVEQIDAHADAAKIGERFAEGRYLGQKLADSIDQGDREGQQY